VGDAETVAPVVALKLVFGAHENVYGLVAPVAEAESEAVLPEQIVGELTVTVGDAMVGTVTVPVTMQAFTFEIETV
jgi:hypothetical protein